MSTAKPERLTRKERQRLTREQILAAARETFEERGYAGSSLEEIAARAGFTRKAVYSNFTGKADLLLEIIDRQMQVHVEWVESFLGSAMTASQTTDLGAAFSSFFGEERAWEQLFHEFLIVAARDEEIGSRFRSRLREAKEAITQVVEERTQEAGVKLALPPHRLVLGVFALMMGIALEKLLDPEQIDDALFGDMLALIGAGAALGPADPTSGK